LYLHLKSFLNKPETMKKTGSFGSRTTPKKQPEAKSSSLNRSTGKVGSGAGSAAFNRRSPVVTDATIATSSVIQAAADPKIKELVMKQQQIFERESMGDKRTPRSRDAANALFHSLDHAHTPTHHTPSHASSFWKHASFGEPLDHQPDGMIPETPERVHGKFAAHTADVQSSHHQQPHFLHHPTTPGSAVETVTHQQDSAGLQDDDGVSSELTADAGEQLLVMCDFFLASLTMRVSLACLQAT
jgi:hypothetical protein